MIIEYIEAALTRARTGKCLEDESMRKDRK
jgi:hypothetical protein